MRAVSCLPFQPGFPFFSLFNSMANISSMLNRSGQSQLPCLVPDFREKTSSFTIKYELAVHFFGVPCTRLRKFPFISGLSCVFIINCIKLCPVFFCICEDDYGFFYCLFCWPSKLHWLGFEHWTTHSQDSSPWLWYIILFCIVGFTLEDVKGTWQLNTVGILDWIPGKK